MQRESSGGRKGGRYNNNTSNNKKGGGPPAAPPRTQQERRTTSNGSSSSRSQQPTHHGGRRQQTSKNHSPGDDLPYSPYLSLEECLKLYSSNNTNDDDDDDDLGADGVIDAVGDHRPGAPRSRPVVAVVRGKLRVNSRDALAFVTCDRGRFARDITIPTPHLRNRAMDGDQVFVLLDPLDEEGDEDENEGAGDDNGTSREEVPVTAPTKSTGDQLEGDDETEAGDRVLLHSRDPTLDAPAECITWQDDPKQMQLWNPIVTGIPLRSSLQERIASAQLSEQQQRSGRVVYVYPPKALDSELPTTDSQKARLAIPNRRIVGTLQQLGSGTLLFNPQHRSLPQFRCPTSTRQLLERLLVEPDPGTEEPATTMADLLNRTLFQAEYVPLSWEETHKWPPCRNVQKLGNALELEHEIQALVIASNVDHGDFAPPVLQCVDEAVRSGLYDAGIDNNHDNGGGSGELGWKPTPDMLHGRRDYRSERIFTIDPTTAKDLDDALHIKRLPPSEGNGRDDVVEVGVHIADVSFFVRPGTPVDEEAQFRTTTVYLVDRTIPMLPRPLCEIACSLNENVERLAFSCVWKMYLDGTMVPGPDSVWYGRTVIKSCARLDYSTAQNIIENQVATGESSETVDDALWPPHRRPTAPHTIDQVAADVRLMNRVAVARRRIRFENGALALNGIKLTFQLDSDGQTPLLVAPYPIRDSNRLVEEYMLLANYLVAQRLLTHAKTLSVLRMHPPPLMSGLGNVVNVAAAAGIPMDISTSQKLHESLVRVSRQGDPLILQCLTNLLMTPMQAAEYFVVGCHPNPEDWRHYALNIPYYTHFTSPIRRYPDVMVHRLLQATIDGPDALQNFPMTEQVMDSLCNQSNDKRLASKEAQERCDRVYLSLYVRDHPMVGQLGVVLSVGINAFTVFLPSVGASAMLYLAEHGEMLTYAADEGDKEGAGSATGRRLLLQRKPSFAGPLSPAATPWKTLEIVVLVKLAVTVVFKDRPPIDIKTRLEGPWKN